MVEVATGDSGTRAIRTDWPNTEGLIAGTTKLKDDFELTPEEKSLILSNDKVGI